MLVSVIVGVIVGSRGWLIIGGVVVSGWVLGLVQGVLSAWITPILLKLLLLGGLVGAMAGLLKVCCEHGLGEKRRGFLPLVGVPMGVLALLGSWCGWVWAASDYNLFLALHPLDLYDVVRGVTERVEYTASSRGMEVGVSRSSVRAAWLIEAVTIGLAPVVAGVLEGCGEKRKDWGI